MIEYQLSRAAWWLYLNTKLITTCPMCASGRSVKRVGFWHYVHPRPNSDDKVPIRCKTPSYWIYMEEQKRRRRAS